MRSNVLLFQRLTRFFSARNPRVKQTIVLYGSEITLILLTFATGIMNSRFLGAVEYGLYSFVITVVDVIMIFTGFGYPQSGARIVALSKSTSDERQIEGALVFIATIMGVGVALTLALLTPAITQIFSTVPKPCLILASGFCITVPMQLILTQACRGANKIGLLALMKILPKGLYLVGGLFIVFWTRLTGLSALALYFGGVLVSCILVIVLLRVRFAGLRANISIITAEVKRYGFHSFLGGIADNSTFKLNNLLIAGFVSTTWLGFYGIASTIVSPMVTFSTSLSTSAYRSLAQKDSIDSKVFVANAAFLTITAVLIAAIARPLIGILLTAEFVPAAGLVYILVFTAFFQGMYQPINAFLGAHGRGRELRAISFWVSLVNLFAAAVFIPRIGAYGAALGSSLAKLCELIGNVYFYRRVVTKLKEIQIEPDVSLVAK